MWKPEPLITGEKIYVEQMLSNIYTLMMQSTTTIKASNSAQTKKYAQKVLTQSKKDFKDISVIIRKYYL